jgi:hypothetical protein
MRQWTDLAFSSIYYLIKKLEKAALITAVDAGPTRRTTYAPTAEGLTAAREATFAALATVSPAHPVVLVGLANLPLLTTAKHFRPCAPERTGWRESCSGCAPTPALKHPRRPSSPRSSTTH